MMDRFRTRRTGMLLVATAAMLWSTAGVFVRVADLDTMTIVAWRSVFSFLTLAVIVTIQHRADFARIVSRLGVPAGVSVAASVVSTISYIFALRMTTVATVMTVYASVPFIAGAIGFVWLRERVTPRFLVAGTVALGGIAVTAGAAATSRDGLGIAAAFVMTASFAVQLVHAKRHPRLQMTVVSALTAVVCALVTAPFMQHALPTPPQLLACALFGILTTGVAYVLILEGSRLIPSGEAALVSMLDVVLGPFWVWLFFAEQPATPVLVGGAIVLGSVVWYLATNRPLVAAKG